jgi:hypothetical protein
MYKSIFFFVVFRRYTEKNILRLLNHLNYLKKITPKKSKIVVLDLSRYYLGKNFSGELKIKKKGFNYFKPKNISDLKSYTNGAKIFCMGLINQKIKLILVLLIIKKLKFKLIEILAMGYFPQAYNKVKINLLYRLHLAITYKGNYYVMRLLSIFNITPKIEYCFEASQSRINKIKKNQSKKFLYFFSYKNVAYFKNIIRVNSELYQNIRKKTKLKKKYIVYIDSGFDHPDITTKEIYVSEISRKKFYDDLFNFLSRLENILNKKLVYCKHPKATYPKYFDKFEKKFKVSTGKAEHYINKSYIVVIAVSTLMNYAFLLKKNVIIAGSRYWGNLVRDKIASIREETNIPYFNIGKYNNISKLNLLNKFKNNKKIQNKFIQSNLIVDNKKNHYEQLKFYLDKISN